jgi:hypothetical protein
MSNRYFGKDGFLWWKGVVEDRKDPLLLGRVRVRIFGWHTDPEDIYNKQNIPTEDLPWATYVAPPDDGQNISGLKEGDWVIGFFLDAGEAQRPCVFGKIHGIPEDEADPNLAYNDPTPDEELANQPRPPSGVATENAPPEIDNLDEQQEVDNKPKGRFADPDKLPGNTTSFGVLAKDYDRNNYKFDINRDGVYDDTDAELIAWDYDRDGELKGVEQNKNWKYFAGHYDSASAQTLPLSRYPLSYKLKEPTTSRLARNEKIEETIVALKKGNLATAESANYTGSAGAGDIAVATSFGEPETPYDAVYPFNHVYESESGHIIEVDDTPGAERLHRYHRSGTFEEIHPSGLRVDKTVDDQYNLTTKNYYHHSLEESRFTSDTNIRLKSLASSAYQSGGSMNFDSGGNMNISVGSNQNVTIGSNQNVTIKGDGWTFVGGEQTLYIESSAKIFVKEKLSIRSESDINITAQGTLHLEGMTGMVLSSPQTTGYGVGYMSQWSCGHALGATAAPVPPPSPVVVPPVINEALPSLISDIEDAAPEISVTLPGFVLKYSGGGDDGVKVNDLYKPISEGDGKLVCLSAVNEPIKLYHAIPTGELEEVTIEYLHEDLTRTSWTVIRPVHTFDEDGLIEVGTSTGELEGRYVWRFSKPGREYPKQMIMVTGANPDGWLILDSAVRHD